MKAALPTPANAGHQLRCVHCGTMQAAADRMFRCTHCSELLEVIYPNWAGAGREFGLRLREIWRERRGSTLPENASGVWRFRELLPQIERQSIVTMSEGNTPLLELTKAARDLRVARVLAKHQGMNPTGSFKDTGISVAISMAKTEGYSLVCCASTGNTSASVAAYAARAGLKSMVLLPAGQVASGKLAQALEYGAHVLQLQADFDGCLKV
ncbi:MAG: threonine synthase, partial [Candidatus Angelobacter sp.]